MHERHVYGDSGKKWAGTVAEIADSYGCLSVLDYGSGTGAMARRLGSMGAFVIDQYDPAVPGVDSKPYPADMVSCIDTLEHIEPHCLANVLDHIHTLARNVVFFVIALRLAGKRLPDGRNAHLIVESKDWWAGQLTEKFRLIFEVMRNENEWAIVMEPVR